MNMEKTFICDYCKKVFNITQRTDHTIKCQDKFMNQKYNQMNQIRGNNIKGNKRYNLQEKEVEKIIFRNNINIYSIRNQKHSQDKAKVLLTENINNLIPVISRENKMNKIFNNNTKSYYGDQIAKTFYVDKSVNNAKMIHELPKIPDKNKKDVPLSMNKKGKSNINILKKNLKMNYSNEKVKKLNGKLRLNNEKKESRNKEEEKLVKEKERKIKQKGDNKNRKLLSEKKRIKYWLSEINLIKNEEFKKEKEKMKQEEIRIEEEKKKLKEEKEKFRKKLIREESRREIDFQRGVEYRNFEERIRQMERKKQDEKRKKDEEEWGKSVLERLRKKLEDDEKGNIWREYIRINGLRKRFEFDKKLREEKSRKKEDNKRKENKQLEKKERKRFNQLNVEENNIYNFRPLTSGNINKLDEYNNNIGYLF